jgi:hypothetical protein
MFSAVVLALGILAGGDVAGGGIGVLGAAVSSRPLPRLSGSADRAVLRDEAGMAPRPTSAVGGATGVAGNGVDGRATGGGSARSKARVLSVASGRSGAGAASARTGTLEPAYVSALLDGATGGCGRCVLGAEVGR